MKIRYVGSVNIDTDLHVSVEDITSALQESLSVLEHAHESGNANDRTKTHLVSGFINSLYGCLHAITDEMRASLSDEHCKIIQDGFAKELAKFERKGDSE